LITIEIAQGPEAKHSVGKRKGKKETKEYNIGAGEKTKGLSAQVSKRGGVTNPKRRVKLGVVGGQGGKRSATDGMQFQIKKGCAGTPVRG